MVTVKKSQQRGHANHGWLDSYHSFSFAEYYDPANMQYSVLRVINEDKVAGGGGFGMHPHRDMEIITYMLAGKLKHQDSMGNGAVIGVGDVQHMTAGTGVRHSEFNASATEAAHLLQIWITPNEKNLQPSYQDKHFDADAKRNQWRLIVSPDAREGSMAIHQDVLLYASILEAGQQLAFAANKTRCGYLQLASGELTVNKQTLYAGDALMFENETQLTLEAINNSEMLLFDLPQV